MKFIRAAYPQADAPADADGTYRGSVTHAAARYRYAVLHDTMCASACAMRAFLFLFLLFALSFLPPREPLCIFHYSYTERM